MSLTNVPRAEQWATQICTQLSKSAEAIIATGRLLVKAKADLPHGEWERMFEESLVPLGIRSAQMLMAVAEHPTLSNTKHVSLLPPSWGTLYELTKVPDAALNNAFRDGLITPHMERREVKALLPIGTAPTRVPGMDAVHAHPNATIDRSPAASLERRATMREMAAEGHSSRQMAAVLGLSEKSCRTILREEGIDAPGDRAVGGMHRHDANRIVDRMVQDAEHLCADVNLIEFDDLDASQFAGWLDSLKTSRDQLMSFIRRLTKEQQKHVEAA